MELSAPYSLSRRVPSATRPPLRGRARPARRAASVKARRATPMTDVRASRRDPSLQPAPTPCSRVSPPARARGAVRRPPTTLRDALVARGARCFGVPRRAAARARRRRRRARVVARAAAGATAERPRVDDLPALAELVGRRGAGARRSTRERASSRRGSALAPARPPARWPLRAPARPTDVLAARRPRAACVAADDAELGERVRRRRRRRARPPAHRAEHARHADRASAALTRAAKTLNESLDLETAARAASARRRRRSSTPTSPSSTAARRATGCAIGGVARPAAGGVGYPLPAGRRASPARSLRAAAGRCSPTTTSASPALPAGLAVRAASQPRSPCRSTGTASCAACCRVGYGAPAPVGPERPRAARDLRRARRRRVPRTRARTPASRTPRAPTALTGCLNHAALHERPRRARSSAPRAAPAAPLSLVLIDLDDFKQVNEEHGHLVGDEVLRRVGHALRSAHAPLRPRRPLRRRRVRARRRRRRRGAGDRDRRAARSTRIARRDRRASPTAARPAPPRASPSGRPGVDRRPS